MSNLLKVFTFLVTAIMALLPSMATAQNLLVNGDFEAQPYPIGHNKYVNVTGWNTAIVTGSVVHWSRGNIVGVDGPGPSNFGSPGIDATGGTGNRHYLDGLGHIQVWQHYVAPCDGPALASVAFSVRDGLGQSTSRLAVQQLNSAGIILPATTQPANNSSYAIRTDVENMENGLNFTNHSFTNGGTSAPWTVVSQSVQLVEGQTYVFWVDLNQDANMDNASVEMVNGCAPELPVLDTEETSIQKVCQAPVAGIQNGTLGHFWSCQITVNASPNPFSGTLTVSDSPNQSYGNTSASLLTMTSASGNFDCTAPGSCTIDGANFTNPSEVINVQTFVQTSGEAGGDIAGNTMQNCTSGTYQNDDTTTAINGGCVTASFTPRSSSSKTCEPVTTGEAGRLKLSCTITVTGSDLPSGSYVTAMDGFAPLPLGTPNFAGTVMNFSSSENWSCIGGNNVGICELSAADLFQAGGTSQIQVEIDFENSSNASQAVNCPFDQINPTSVLGEVNARKSAPASPFAKSSFSLPDTCVTVDLQRDLEDAKVTKVCKASEEGELNGKTGRFWNCAITVDAQPTPFSGTFSFDENASAISGSTNANIVGVSHSNPDWSCLPTAPVQSTTCEIDGANFSPSGSETVNVQLFVETQGKPIKWENCVRGLYKPMNGDARAFDGNCETTTWTPPKLPPLEKVEISKVCKGPEEGEFKDEKGLVWNCSITVQAIPTPFSGTFSFDENASGVSSSGGASLISVNHANPDWTCSPNFPNQVTTCEIDGANFSPSGSETVDFKLFAANYGKPVKGENCVVGRYKPIDGEPREYKGNCVPITWTPKPDEKTTYKIEKICEPRGKRHILSTKNWVQAYRCAITVTTNGVPFTNALYVSDALTVGGNSGSSLITGLSSNDPWNCSPMPIPQNGSAGCSILGTQFPHSTGSSTIFVDMTVNSGLANQGMDNCGTLIALDPETAEQTPLGESCTTIFEEQKDEPKLDVTKVCAQPVRNGNAWNVACTVTISGTNLPAGHQIRLSDEMNSIAGYSATNGQFQTNAAQCGGTTNSSGVLSGCDLTTDQITAAGGNLTFDYIGSFTSNNLNGVAGTAQNCAFADVPSLNLHAPTGGNGKACVPLKLGNPIIDDPKKRRNLAVKKEQVGSCVAGSPCAFRFTLTNTGDVPMSYPQLVDTISPSNGVTVQTVSADWSCAISGGQIICNPLSPNTLAAGASRSIDVTLTLPANAKENYENCVAIQWSPYAIPYTDRSVRSVQQVLTNKGYKPGTVDGVMGRNTRDAIRQFESRNGLPVTGEINERFATLLFGEMKPLKFGDDISSDDKSCIGVEDSSPVVHSKFRSLMEPFHRLHKSSLHDGRKTKLVHDLRRSRIDEHDTKVSRVHRTHKSEQHESRSTRIIDTHRKYRSRLEEFHRTYRSRQHDGKTTRLRHDRKKSREDQHDKRLSRFHRRFKSEQHDPRTTQVRDVHNKAKSRLRDFHRKYKSNQHDGKRTRLRHDKKRSRMDEFHRKYKSQQHNARTTRVIREHSKSRSFMREFHRRYKSNQHDQKTSRVRKAKP